MQEAATLLCDEAAQSLRVAACARNAHVVPCAVVRVVLVLVVRYAVAVPALEISRRLAQLVVVIQRPSRPQTRLRHVESHALGELAAKTARRILRGARVGDVAPGNLRLILPRVAIGPEAVVVAEAATLREAVSARPEEVGEDGE